MPTQISLHHVTGSCAGPPLLDGVSLAVRPGERIGIVGQSSAGKSPLLCIIARLEPPDEGRAALIGDGDTGRLGQTPDLPPEAPPPDHTVQDAIHAIHAALTELREIEARLRCLEAVFGGATTAQPDTYGDLLTRFELRGGYEADARIDRALHGLGLDGLERDRLLGSLSGSDGQARLGLACPFAGGPAALLLDEPTNHLVLALAEELEETLAAWPGALVVASRDRLPRRRFAGRPDEIRDDRPALVAC